LATNWVVFETQVQTPVKPSQARLISQEHTDTLWMFLQIKKKKLVLNHYKKKINTVIEICIATLCTYTYYIYIGCCRGRTEEEKDNRQAKDGERHREKGAR
jgi:hypothetical protein